MFRHIFKETEFITKGTSKFYEEMSDGMLQVGVGTRIESGVEIEISDMLIIGPESNIRSGCKIKGRNILLGRSFYFNNNCEIGGGSAFGESSRLTIGDWFQGHECHINTARQVYIGNCVGFGRGTKIYTHGAHLSVLDGFPAQWGGVAIGNNVWIPGATVNPGVAIGSNTVIAVGSVVCKDIDSGSLAGGIPAKVIRENEYPKDLTEDERYAKVAEIAKFAGLNVDDILFSVGVNKFTINGAKFNLTTMEISGDVSEESEVLRNELRRNGVRFRNWHPDNVLKCFSASYSKYRTWNDPEIEEELNA